MIPIGKTMASTIATSSHQIIAGGVIQWQVWNPNKSWSESFVDTSSSGENKKMTINNICGG